MPNDFGWNRVSYDFGLVGLEDKLKKKTRKCKSCTKEYYAYNPEYCKVCWVKLVAFKKSDISLMDKSSYEKEERVILYLKQDG